MEQLFEGECRFSVMFFYLEDSQKNDRNVNYHLTVQVLKALREYQHLDDISGKILFELRGKADRNFNASA